MIVCTSVPSVASDGWPVVISGKDHGGKLKNAEEEAAELPAEFWAAKVKQLIRLRRPNGDLAVMNRPERWWVVRQRPGPASIRAKFMQTFMQRFAV